jgi:putative Holliday junction resolvase
VFAERLRNELGIEVVTWDERLSTGLVERSLLEADMSRAKRKRVRDKLAAQVILQGFLEARGAGDPAIDPYWDETDSGPL